MATDGSLRPPPTVRNARIRTAAGFTLIELVVALVLLGLGAALVAPMFRRDESPAPTMPQVLAAARELAVRRAESLQLRIANDGAWRLTTTTDTSSIASGALADGSTAGSWRMTPMGACLAESSSGAMAWDAAACAPVGGWPR